MTEKIELFRLTESIDNPNKDLRVKQDWRKGSRISSGATFIVETKQWKPGYVLPEPIYIRKMWPVDLPHKYICDTSEEALFKAILDKSEKAEPTIATILCVNNITSIYEVEELLELGVKGGIFSLEQINSFILNMKAKQDEEA